MQHTVHARSDHGLPHATGRTRHAIVKAPTASLRSALAGPYDGRGRMEPGTVLADKYRVGHVLGRGGMGMVAFADHLQLMQPVAIKFLHPLIGHDADAIARLLREAQATARLRSEHVARVLDVGALPGGTPFIVMEHLEGQDVASLLRAGPLAAATAVDMVLQVCEGLAEAHSLGIVHRDLKPSNLFVTRRRDGTPLVKILDFGISKTTVEQDALAAAAAPAASAGDAVDTQRSGDDAPPTGVVVPLACAPRATPGAAPGAAIDPACTRTEAVMGTPGYMSPEHMRSSKHVDARTDLWSLGVVLYELLAGRRPFHGDTRAALREQITSAAPPPLGGAVPSGLARVVARCLEKAPEDRFADVAALAEALAPFSATPPQAMTAARRMARILGTRADGTGTFVAGEVPTPARPTPTWRFAAGALAVAGVVTLVMTTRSAPIPRVAVPPLPAPTAVPAAAMAVAPAPVPAPAAVIAPVAEPPTPHEPPQPAPKRRQGDRRAAGARTRSRPPVRSPAPRAESSPEVPATTPTNPWLAPNLDDRE
jgi:serine/threonine protein kinase